jgi:hypothetical protein
LVEAGEASSITQLPFMKLKNSSVRSSTMKMKAEILQSTRTSQPHFENSAIQSFGKVALIFGARGSRTTNLDGSKTRRQI